MWKPVSPAIGNSTTLLVEAFLYGFVYKIEQGSEVLCDDDVVLFSDLIVTCVASDMTRSLYVDAPIV